MAQRRVAQVLMNQRFVGELERHEQGFRFTYDPDYIADKTTFNLSASLKKQTSAFESPYLFPFFEGLLSEGWMRKIQEKNQKIDEKDPFTRLIKNGSHLIGAISIRAEGSE